VPAAVLESNNREIYSAFVRGFFEADGKVLESVPSFSTSSDQFADEVRNLLLALGLITTTRATTSGYGSRISQVRLRNLDHAVRFLRTVGFVSRRKTALLASARCRQSGNRDRIYVPRAVWDEIVPIGHDCRRMVISALAKSGGVSRQTATRIASVTPDRRLRAALGYAFEHVSAILGSEELCTTQAPGNCPAPLPAWP
jgi:ribonucleoside-diphosphate reductase alpha chain